MRRGVVERLGFAVLGLAAVSAVTVPLAVEANRRQGRASGTPTIELTAVMETGVWTDEPVTASTAWRIDHRRAHPVLRVDQPVRILLRSADVVHSFAVPGLGVDRIEVYPGKTVELMLTPSETGVFEYYCTTVCGEPHFSMRGFIEVTADGARGANELPGRPGAEYWLTAEPKPGAGTLARGAWLYQQRGCVTCHGEAGAGGVPNPNSMNPTVPELRSLARRTFLFDAADADAFVGSLERNGARAPETQSPPVVPLFPIVMRQYEATRKLVREGRASSRLDPRGPRPPLDMPAWGSRLSDREIDSILAYLLTLGRPAVANVADVPIPTSPEGAPP